MWFKVWIAILTVQRIGVDWVEAGGGGGGGGGEGGGGSSIMRRKGTTSCIWFPSEGTGLIIRLGSARTGLIMIGRICSDFSQICLIIRADAGLLKKHPKGDELGDKFCLQDWCLIWQPVAFDSHPRIQALVNPIFHTLICAHLVLNFWFVHQKQSQDLRCLLAQIEMIRDGSWWGNCNVNWVSSQAASLSREKKSPELNIFLSLGLVNWIFTSLLFKKLETEF